jgi:hypothetical protein
MKYRNCGGLIVLVVFFLIFPSLYSQELLKNNYYSLKIKTLELDTVKLLSDTPIKSPWGAVARSAVLPGWGQVYNQQYLKAGVAVGVNSFLVYHIFWYDKKWEETQHSDYRNRRNLYTWYFALAYVLTAVDAYVDAYLYKFDEAMEISHQVNIKENQWFAEVCLSFHF